MFYIKNKISNYLQINPSLQWPAASLTRALYMSPLRGGQFFRDSESKNFLFIVGCGRSGNTLLRKLLMQEYDLYIPPETYVLPKQIIRYAGFAQRSWGDKVDSVLSALEYHPEFYTFNISSLYPFSQEAKKWPEEERKFSNLINRLYHWIGRESGINAQWVGDKTPLNALSLGIIGKAFPESKFIFLERDPVDVVSSYLDTGIYSSAEGAALRWLKSYIAWNKFIKNKDENSTLEIKYEDMVIDTGKVISEIGRKFKIPAITSDRLAGGLNLGDVDVHKHHSNVINPPVVTSIGKGRKSISKENLEKIRKVLGDKDIPQSRGYEKV